MGTRKNNAKVNPDSQSEAEQFVDFARKLVSVPKAEIDQKQAEYHRRRIKEREAARKPPRKTAS